MDPETQLFVQSFVRFLNRQIASTGFPPDIVESLEVATQCLETAYNLPVPTPASGDTAAVAAAEAAEAVDLQDIYRRATQGEAERKLQADAVKNDGNKLMRMDNFTGALECYNRAIQLDPTNPILYCNRAAAYSRLGDFERAADDCRKSICFEPRYSKAYGRLGIALSKLGQPDGAVYAYECAVRLEPNNADYRNNLEVALQQREENLQQHPPQQQQQSRPATGQSTNAPGPSSAVPPTQTPPQPQQPQAAPMNFQLPLNGMDTLQSVMAQPAVRDLMQQMMSGEQGQVPDMLRNVFQAGGPAGGPAGGGGGGGMAGLAGLLGGGGLANIGNLLSQLNGAGGAGGAANGGATSQDHQNPQ